MLSSLEDAAFSSFSLLLRFLVWAISPPLALASPRKRSAYQPINLTILRLSVSASLLSLLGRAQRTLY